MQNNIEPIPARAAPTAKVKDITLLTFIPMSWAVSKSSETARIALPTFKYLIKINNKIIDTSEIKTVIISTILTELFPKSILALEIKLDTGNSFLFAPNKKVNFMAHLTHRYSVTSTISPTLLSSIFFNILVFIADKS